MLDLDHARQSAKWLIKNENTYKWVVWVAL